MRASTGGAEPSLCRVRVLSRPVERHRDLSKRSEVGNTAVTATGLEDVGRDAGRDDIATTKLQTEPRQLVRQPRHHIEGMPQDRRAGTCRDDLAVAGDGHSRRGQVVVTPLRHRLPTNPPAMYRVVGRNAQRTDGPRFESVVDDLDGRYQRVDVLRDGGTSVAAVDCIDVVTDAKRELGLDDAMRELVGRERRAAG